MTEWETIRDSTSHISHVRLIPPRNYSVERGDDIFNAFDTAIVKPSVTMNEAPIPKNSQRNYLKFMKKSTIYKSILVLIIAISALSTCWYYSSNTNSTNIVCTSATRIPIWIKDTKSTINRSYSQVTQPVLLRVHRTRLWIDIIQSDITNKTCRWHDTLYNSSTCAKKYYYNNIHTHIISTYNKFKEIISMSCAHFRQQLDDYINYNENEKISKKSDNDREVNEIQERETIVQEKMKKTAKRILEYIDQMNKESIKSGMKQEEAKEKAQEIIKSITIPAASIMISTNDSNDMDVVEFEILSIKEHALFEKKQLKEQLDQLQLHLLSEPTSEQIENIDMELLVAVKAEVDMLRANAENSVRKRTEQALQKLNKLDFSTVDDKDRIRQAQREAMKELRQVYRDIYQTNLMIDKLLATTV